jgi:hypothetical protein
VQPRSAIRLSRLRACEVRSAASGCLLVVAILQASTVFVVQYALALNERKIARAKFWHGPSAALVRIEGYRAHSLTIADSLRRSGHSVSTHSTR